MLKFQSLDSSHIQHCLDILTAAFLSPWHELDTVFSNPSNVIFGAFVDDRLAGFVIFMTVLDEAEILMCVVDPKYQYQGIATDILDHSFSILRQQNIAKLFLEVDVANIAAQNLYTKLGFQIISSRKAYYLQPNGSYNDGIIMQLVLNN